MSRAPMMILMTALSAMSASLALADVADDTRLSYEVSYSDLDPARDPGAAALYQRLTSAAQRVCAPLAGQSLAHISRHRACVVEAVDTAVAKVDKPLVTAMHRSKFRDRSSVSVEVAKN